MKISGKVKFAGAAASFALLVAALFFFKVAPSNEPQVVIIGAGLSGLAAAYELEKAGIKSVIYEASARIGGRTWTANLFRPEFHEEQGASNIASDHAHMIKLATELNVTLLEESKQKYQAYQVLVLNKKIYTEKELFHLFVPTLKKIIADGKRPDVLERFNHLSMEQYLQQIKAPHLLKEWVKLATLSEFGLSYSQANALHLFELCVADFDNEYFSFLGGAGDEKYVAKNGVSEFSSKLESRLTSSIHLNHELSKVATSQNGFNLSLNTPDGPKQISAQNLLVTIPLALLRKKLSLELADFDVARWRASFDYLLEGSNQKVNYYFSQRNWLDALAGATTFAVDGNIFIDTTFKQEKSGIFCLMNYRGDTASEVVTKELVEKNLQLLFDVVPNLKSNYLGYSIALDWAHYPFSQMSYTGARKIGAFFESETLNFNPMKGLYFSGEAWSEDFGGFMEGAVQTGQRAAQAIIKRYKEEA